MFSDKKMLVSNKWSKRMIHFLTNLVEKGERDARIFKYMQSSCYSKFNFSTSSIRYKLKLKLN